MPEGCSGIFQKINFLDHCLARAFLIRSSYLLAHLSGDFSTHFFEYHHRRSRIRILDALHQHLAIQNSFTHRNIAAKRFIGQSENDLGLAIDLSHTRNRNICSIGRLGHWRRSQGSLRCRAGAGLRQRSNRHLVRIHWYQRRLLLAIASGSTRLRSTIQRATRNCFGLNHHCSCSTGCLTFASIGSSTS
jgi:hypothetical protein